MTGATRHRRPAAWAIGLLALLAYVPALTAAPGRMPSDSKLYLYLDPGRLIGDAASSFDGRQFAGWVPHQHVAYLWPSGPWFWLFELLTVPDWIAHRLWIGTIMLAAGAGVRWCARLLGLGQEAAITAAVVYQLALYVLPYVSRTSVMLLPWAGLGWIVALTIRATRRHTWGDPAAIALVVLTVGAVNATALAMIVPGPVLWLVHSLWQRSIDGRQAVLVAARTTALSSAVSVWWISMLVIRGRFGTDVLPYSESLADVSLTATSAEVWRSLGYWLFYVRDPAAAATTESLRYLVSTPAIVVSYLVPLTALAAMTWLRWAHRRFAMLLVVVGMVLAVGVHPVGDRAPLMRLLAGDDEAGLALALRSSTRALPVMMLGVALALAMAVQAASTIRLPRLRWPGHHVAGVAIVALAVANMPSLWTGAFVDPALERDQDPPSAWLDAATALDGSDTDARVLQLPGVEFGAYRWGYTVDQPVPGLTDKPLVTRDLLPLGSAGAMDLLYALDDRAQDGILESDSVAPIASLLGADTVWLTNDIAFERFRTARPEVVRDIVLRAPGVGPPTGFGEPFLNRPDVPVTDERSVGDDRVGEPLRPVELAPLDDGGTVVRAATHQLLVSGNGDGLVDAAAAGLLAPGRAVVRYTADLQPAEGGEAVVGLLVTDSNRDRARHWRSSQDVTGFTESGGPGPDLLRPMTGDARLDVFVATDASTQTIALQRGPVTATATSYGEPFALLPEHRPVMAVDGDLDTAWLVGEHGDPIGESIRLEYDGPARQLTLRQPDTPGTRRITGVRVVEADPTLSVSEIVVELDERSWTGAGQVVALASRASSGTIDLIIDAVAGGEPFTGSAVAGVGFSEIDLGLGPTVEVVRPPHDALVAVDPATPLALEFSRLRTDPMDRWRDDPEPRLVRELDLPARRTFTAEPSLRIDARATDQALADLFGWPAVASTRLLGSPRHAGVAAIDDDPSTSWITGFDEAEGAQLTISGASEPIDRIRLRQPIAGFSEVTTVTLRSGDEERIVQLEPDAAGASTGRVSPALPAGDIRIELTEIETVVATDRRFGDPVTLPAAVSEVAFDGRPSVVPVPDQRVTIDCLPIVAVDGVPISATIEIADWLDDTPLTATPCEPTVTMDAGTHSISAIDTDVPIVLDRIVFDDGLDVALDAADSAATVEVVDQGRFDRTVVVDGCPDGCWLVLGEGFNAAWTARGPDGVLGPHRMVDGGFNGWWVEGADDPVTIELRWTAQRTLTAALVVSLLTALLAFGLVVRDRLTGRAPAIPALPAPALIDADGRTPRRSVVVAAVAWTSATVLLVGFAEAWWGLLAAALVVLTRRPRLAELTAFAGLLVVAAGVVARERRSAPPPDGGWPGTFESFHTLGMFAVVALLVAAITADDADDDAIATAAPDEMSETSETAETGDVDGVPVDR